MHTHDWIGYKHWIWLCKSEKKLLTNIELLSPPGCRDNVIISWRTIYWVIVSLQAIVLQASLAIILQISLTSNKKKSCESKFFYVRGYQKITFRGALWWLPFFSTVTTHNREFIIFIGISSEPATSSLPLHSLYRVCVYVQDFSSIWHQFVRLINW